MSDFNVWSYFAKLGVQVRVPGDSFFEEGDRVCKIGEPVFLTLDDVEEFLHKDYEEFCCQAPGCTAKFSQLLESEQHYNSSHRHSCSVCKKSLPSYHLLELHIQETHDSFFSVLSERKPSFQCFLPTCGLKFWGAEERREHAIASHNFPSNFRFDQGKKAPRKKSGKKEKKNGAETEESSGREGSRNGDEMEVEKPKQKLAFRRKSRGAFEKKDSLEKIAPTEMEVVEVPRVKLEPRKVELELRPTELEVRKNGSECGAGVGGSRMDVDGEEVVLRRAPEVRRPISLARMGERRSVCVESPLSPPPLPSPSRQSFHVPPPDVSDGSAFLDHTGFQPAKQDGGCSRQSVGCIRLGDLGSPRRPAPTSTLTSVNAAASPGRDLGSDSPVSSPRKSKIPVRSNSLRAPKTFSFGAGVPRTFQRPKSKHWYQSTQNICTATDIQHTDFQALNKALPST